MSVINELKPVDTRNIMKFI